MTPAAPMPWRPLYNADETLDQFAARQRGAFGAFELAWREGRVSVKLKAYYDQVVRDVGANAYAWWREQRWAEVFGVSTSTIKRVVAALVQAGLIRRERCYGRASRTYLTAYDVVVNEEETRFTDNQYLQHPSPHSLSLSFPQANDTATTSASHTADAVSLHCQTATPGTTDVEFREASTESEMELCESLSDLSDYRQTTPVSFGRRSEPTIGSRLVPDSVKNHHATIGAGGCLHPAPSAHPVVQRLLELEGVSDFVLAAQLMVQPVDEMEAVSQYLDTQHTVRDRPRLFAWLATNGFGSQLLAGRGRHGATTQRRSHPADRRAAARSAHDRRAPAAAVDWAAHVCPMCQVRYVEADGTPCFDCTVQPAADADTLPPVPDPARSRSSEPPLPSGQGAPGRTHQGIWEQVCAMLAADVDGADLALWLAGSTLLDVTPTTAVVGVGNVFLRDELAHCATPAIEAALAAAFGRPVSVSVVVDGSPS